MEENNFIALLIENVRAYRILYDLSDPDYKDPRKKNEIWNSIAANMPVQTTGEDLKKKWKNLRDSYTKHIRANNIGELSKSVSRYKFWPWAEHMEHFKQYLKSTAVSEPCNLENVKNELDYTESEVRVQEYPASKQLLKSTTASEPCKLENIKSELDYAESEVRVQEYPVSSYKRRKTKLVPPPESTTSVIDSSESTVREQYDDIDLIFLGYAASVKKLTTRRQSLIKYKIAKIIMEEEMEQINEETSAESGATSSFTGHSIFS